MKRILLCLCLVLAWSPNKSAGQLLQDYDLTPLVNAGLIPGGEFVSTNGRVALRIVHTNNIPLRVQLLKIEKPSISTKFYSLTGEIKYDAVKGGGFLEMWNFFPPLEPGAPEGQFFSRTLAASGPMGQITGTSDWREFQLPFDRSGTPHPPTRLEVNLILEGRGTVLIGPVRLAQYKSSGSLGGFTKQGDWWSPRDAGLIGGFSGAVIGTLSGLVGWLASRGRARSLVVASLSILTGLGAILVAAGLGALLLRQPYHVWFPLLLLGGLLVLILPGRLRQVRKQYETVELRRMSAADALVS